MKNLRNIFGNTRRLAMEGAAGNEHEHAHHHDEHDHQAKKYQCPMKCEGDKVYDAPGNCPVCNMKLVPVDDKKPHGRHHHQHCC